MRYFLSRAVLLLALALLSSVPAPALASDGQAFFRAGVSAFQAGQFERALAAFERARSRGYRSASLFYNLGVVNYKLKRYSQARRAFRNLLGGDDARLARYNLGLVALGAGDRESARRHFALVYRHDASDKLGRLARRQLEQLGYAFEKSDQTKRTWYLLSSLSGGVEENVNRAPDDGTPQIDAGFAEGVLSAGGFFLGDPQNGLRGDISYYTRHYPDEESVDTTAIQAELGWSTSLASGILRTGLGGVWFRLDDEPRERRSRLNLQYQLPECFGAGAYDECQARLTAAKVEPANGLEAYEGERYTGLLRYRVYWADWRVGLTYDSEVNRRDDFESSGRFISLSPERYTGTLAVRYRLLSRLYTEVSAAWRRTIYPDPNQFFLNNRTITEVREDDRYTYALSLDWRVGANWSILVDLQRQVNESSLQRFRFESDEASLGVQVLF